MQNRSRDAIEALQAATRRIEDPALESLLAQAYLDLGGRLGKAGRVDEGVAVLEDGLARLPASVPVRIGLGYLHLQRGDRSSAGALFLAALAAEPDRHDALVALAAVTALGGDHAAAAGLYRRALEARADDPLTRLNLARCLLELGDREAGEEALRAAVGRAPHLLRLATAALGDPPRGRLFLRPSAAAAFLGATPAT